MNRVAMTLIKTLKNMVELDIEPATLVLKSCLLLIELLRLSLTFPKQHILDSSKLEEFTDDNFKLGEYARKFSKQVEKTSEKGEIACYKQFFLFPECFQKTCTADT